MQAEELLAMLNRQYSRKAKTTRELKATALELERAAGETLAWRALVNLIIVATRSNEIGDCHAQIWQIFMGEVEQEAPYLEP